MASTKAVYAAIIGNAGVAASKLLAAFLSGSPAMFAEAAHSLADLGNDSLLIYGRNRSRRVPDENHQFGHGKELYFWSFVVAVLIFALGASFAFCEGVYHILRPGGLENPVWNYIVLSVSVLFEGGALLTGYREFRTATAGKPLWEALRQSKDPPGFLVVLEDIAALAGVGIAVAGIWLAHHFHQPRFEGIASVLIGGVLTGVSLLIARECKGLLLGEGMSQEALGQIQRIVEQHRGVKQATRPLTMYFGPEAILLAMDVEFVPDLDSTGLAGTIERIEGEVRRQFPRVGRIYIEPRTLGAVA